MIYFQRYFRCFLFSKFDYLPFSSRFNRFYLILATDKISNIITKNKCLRFVWCVFISSFGHAECNETREKVLCFFLLFRFGRKLNSTDRLTMCRLWCHSLFAIWYCLQIFRFPFLFIFLSCFFFCFKISRSI